MKNYCITILIGFFILASSSVNSLGIQGSTTNIVATKAGGLEVSFDLPANFICKDGMLLSPMFVYLSRDGQTFYKTQVPYNHIVLPQLNLKKGMHYLTAEINGFTSTISLTII